MQRISRDLPRLRHGRTDRRIGACAGAALVVLITVLMAVPSEAVGAIQPTSAALNFPYGYGTTRVPTTVGAQGHQGPTVSASDIGLTVPVSSVGAQGTIGPVNLSEPRWVLSGLSATLATRIYKGTPSSRTISSGTEVYLENATTGQTFSKATNIQGYANFTVTEGWWVIQAVAPSGYIDFFQQLDLRSASSSVVRYLLPASYSVVSVNNGPPADDTDLTNLTFATVGPTLYTEIPVALLNVSNANAIIATAYLPSNSTVMFTHINPAFSYAAELVGEVNNLTGVAYGFPYIPGISINVVATHFPVTTNSYYSFPVGGVSSTTGTITGTAFPTTSTWDLTSPTKLSGGITILSQEVEASSPSDTLSLSNAILFLNMSNPLDYEAGTGFDFPTLRMWNSSVVVLPSETPRQVLFGTIYASQSVLMWEAPAATANIAPITQVIPPFSPGYNFQQVPEGYFNSSFIYGFQQITSPQWNEPLHYFNDIIQNFTGYGFDWNDSFIGKTILYDTIVNSQLNLGVNDLNMSYSELSQTWVVFQSGTVGPPSWGPTVYNTSFSWYDDYFGPNVTEIGYVSAPGSPLMNFFTRGTNFQAMKGGSVLHCLFNETLFTNTNPTVNAGWASWQWFLNATLPEFANISYTYFGTSYPSVYEQYFFTSGDTLYDDELNGWIPNSSIVTYDAVAYLKATGLPRLANGISFKLLGNNSVTYTSLWSNTFIGGFFPSGRNISLAHMKFFNAGAGAVAGGESQFPLTIAVSNSTVVSEYWNTTTQCAINQSLGSCSGNNPWAQTPFWFPSSDTYVNLTHISFLASQEGTYISHDYALTNPSGHSWVTDCLFDPVNFTGPASSRLFAVPFAAGIDILTAAALTATGNYFLDLSNYTDPYYFAVNGANDVFSGNRYFVSPTWLGTSYIPAATNLTNKQNATYSIITRGALVSGVFAGEDVPISETSSITTDSSGYGGGPTYTYAPDVLLQSGTATISYANGEVAGPQPNFIWRSYNYSEQVEPTYVEVGVNSTSAPPVQVVLNSPNITAATQYSVTVTGAVTGGVQTIDTYSSIPGSLSIAYTPATMPSLAVFTFGPFNAGSCNVGCGPASVTKTSSQIPNLNLLIILGLGIMVSGILAVAFKKHEEAGGILAAVGIILVIASGWVSFTVPL